MSARRPYLVLIALLCYAILFSQTAHAARLPRKPSAGDLPQQIKLLVAQPTHPQDSVTLTAGVPAQLDGWPSFLFTALFLGFALISLPLIQFATAQRARHATQDRLALIHLPHLTPLRI